MGISVLFELPNSEVCVTTMGEIEQAYIEQEMEQSYINYAMSVIRGRAIPDVRDGLKPVQRRILYGIHGLGLTPNKPHKKSARIVGECFVAGTLAATSRGLIPIEEVEYGDRVYTETGERTVTELYEMPEGPVCQVELENGLSMVTTFSQKLRVLQPDLSYGWKEATKLEPGDWLVLRSVYPEGLGTPLLPPFKGHKLHLGENLAYLLGLFVSDGWIAREGGRSRFGIYNSEYAIAARAAAIIEEQFDYRPTVEEKRYRYRTAHGEELHRGYTVRISRDRINQYLVETFSLEGLRAECKVVPRQVLQAPRRVLFSFISGLIDGDGSIHKNRNLIQYGSISRELIDRLQVLLHHLGVPATRYVQALGQRGGRINGHEIESNYPNYSLEIRGRAARELAVRLELAHPEKQQRLQRLLESEAKQIDFDRIPYAADAVFSELSAGHLGGGWYEDAAGRKFRAGIKYPTGVKIRYSSGLREERLYQPQLVDWGIQEKLERIGSPLARRFDHSIDDGMSFIRVRSINPTGSAKTYDLGVEGEHQFTANGIVAHNCMGKYHPHGDVAIYDTMVNMAQDFSYRYPLIDGQGNFGSIDGDSSAAMRYTEARLAPVATEFLQELDEGTVDWLDNFDESLKEPEVLPAMVPNLLMNGAWGISVGMTTQIPPHNLGELVDGVIYLMDHPHASVKELLAHIPGPDFPTGGLIMGREGIEEMYRTGKGKIIVRGKATIDEDQIIITEIPYQVKKSTIVEAIARKVRSEDIEGVSDLRDESDREGFRVVVDLKRSATPNVVLNQIYRYTPLERTYSAVFLVILDGNPRTLSLKEILNCFIDFRREVVRRRIEHRLEVARKRAHILEGYRIALSGVERVIEIIRAAKDRETAAAHLKEDLALSDEQADSILKMRLARLTALEGKKIDVEYGEKLQQIEEYEQVLGSDVLLDETIKSELREVSENYADERRTMITDERGEVDFLNLIPDHNLMVSITNRGYANAPREGIFKSQGRGGKGVIGQRTKDEDYVCCTSIANARDQLLLFSDKSRVYCAYAYKLPSMTRTAAGKNLRAVVELGQDEVVRSVLPINDFNDVEGWFCLMATKNGIVNRNELVDYSNVHTSGIIALNTDEDDRIVYVMNTLGDGEVILCSRNGKTIRFREQDVRVTNRPSRGVIGIRLDEEDYIVGMTSIDRDITMDKKLLMVTECGYGKRVSLVDFPLQKRGGKGVLGIKLDESSGQLLSMGIVSDQDEFLLITEQKIIRLQAGDVSTYGRYARGVRLMNLDDDDRIVAVVWI